MTPGFARPARSTDAEAITGLLVTEWLLSPLPAVSAAAAALDRAAVTASWSAAIAAPPSSGHLVLVATDPDGVVGVLAAGPAESDGTDSGSDSEIVELVVSPGHRRQGHGSRLMAAWSDLARGCGATGGLTWVRGGDDSARSFLAGCGWAPDGAVRSLDATGDGSELLHQIRLVTSLGEPDTARPPGAGS